MYIFTIKSNNETKHSKRSSTDTRPKVTKKESFVSQGFRDRIPRCRSEGANIDWQRRRTFLVRTEVPRRVHCCEPSVRDADWPNGARERLSRAVCVRAYAYALPSRERTHGEKEKEKEGGERECRWVGCEPLPPGTCAVFE